MPQFESGSTKKLSISGIVAPPQVKPTISNDIDNLINTVSTSVVSIDTKIKNQKYSQYNMDLKLAQLDYTKKVEKLDPMDLQGYQDAYEEYEVIANRYTSDESIGKENQANLISAHTNWSGYQVREIGSIASKLDTANAKEFIAGSLINITDRPTGEWTKTLQELKTNVVNDFYTMDNKEASKAITEVFTSMIKNNLDGTTMTPAIARDLEKAYKDTVLGFDKLNEGKTWFKEGINALKTVKNQSDAVALQDVEAKIKLQDMSSEAFNTHIDGLRQLGVIDTDDIAEAYKKKYQLKGAEGNSTLLKQYLQLDMFKYGKGKPEDYNTVVDTLVASGDILPAKAEQDKQKYQELYTYSNNPDRNNIPTTLLSKDIREVAKELNKIDIINYVKAGNIKEASELALKTNNNDIIEGVVNQGLSSNDPKVLGQNLQNIEQFSNGNVGLLNNVLSKETLQQYYALKKLIGTGETTTQQDVINARSFARDFSKNSKGYTQSSDFKDIFNTSPYKADASKDMEFFTYIGYSDKEALELVEAKYEVNNLSDNIEFPIKYRSNADSLKKDNYEYYKDYFTEVLDGYYEGYSTLTGVDKDRLSIKMFNDNLTIFDGSIPIQVLGHPKEITEGLELLKEAEANGAKSLVKRVASGFKDPKIAEERMVLIEQAIKRVPRNFYQSEVKPIIGGVSKAVDSITGALRANRVKMRETYMKNKLKLKTKSTTKIDSTSLGTMTDSEFDNYLQDTMKAYAKEAGYTGDIRYDLLERNYK